MAKTVLERIAAMSKPSTVKPGCIDWVGPSRIRGYGALGSNRAHRAVLEVKIGRLLDKGEMALHTCDRTCCVNADHIYLGNHTQNMKDISDRGRNNKVGNRRAKISRAHELKALGYANEEIGWSLDVTSPCVSQWFNAYGLTKGKAQPPTRLAKIRMAKHLTAQGWTQKRIAAHLKCGPTTVQRWIRSDDERVPL